MRKNLQREIKLLVSDSDLARKRVAIAVACSFGIGLLSVAQAQTYDSDHHSLQSVRTSVKASQQPNEQLFDAQLVNGVPVQVHSSALPGSMRGMDTTTPMEKKDTTTSVTKRVLSPLLEKYIDTAVSKNTTLESIDVIVTYKEEIALPHFPAANEKEPREALQNIAAVNDAMKLVEDIKAARAPVHARHARELKSQFGAVVKEQFWLINGMQVSMPVGQIRALAKRHDVQSVEFVQLQSALPPAGNLSDARAVMATDTYFNLTGMASGYIGLLDTGADADHTLLNHYSWMRDCVNGGSNCNTGSSLNPKDDHWNHGTSSASLMVGNNNLGNDNRGITGMYLDSFKVFSNSGTDETAAIHGFQTAIPALDRVIVAEIQDYCDENSALSAAADAAYDAGATVVVAAGNYGSATKTVACPGNARKVLTVGAADVTTQALMDYSGRGPTNDNRTKPDVLGPTNVNAASNKSTTALKSFGGTSAATPNVGGATSLFRNYMRGTNQEYDPGQIYAFMINAGRASNMPSYDNNNGAGLVQLPSNGHIWWGSVTASTTAQSTIDIPLFITVAGQSLTATIWWPESIGGNHNDVDMDLFNPAGVAVAGSHSTGSVWEKAQVPNAKLYTGNWILRIKSYNVKNPQKVYYAINFQ